MSQVTTSVGTIDWLDLSTPDIERSVAFYAQLFGWQVDASTAPMGTYYVGRIEGRDAAGMMARGPGMPAGTPAMWSLYIRVDSAETAAARATLLGGQVLHEPFEIPGGSHIAPIADPTGAAFVVVSGPEGMGLVRDEPGAFIGCELLTRDVDAALHFYVEMFGWTTTIDLESSYVTFHHAGHEVGGLMAMPPEVPAEAPAHWIPYFAVADCKAACAAVEQMGGSLAMPLRAMEVQDASIKMAVAEDPLGAIFGLVEHVV